MAKDKPDKSKALAAQDLGDIRTLQKSEPFRRYFQRRVLDPMQESARKILYGAIEGEDLLKEVRRFRVLHGVSKTLVQDEASCLSVLDEGEAEGEDV